MERRVTGKSQVDVKVNMLLLVLTHFSQLSGRAPPFIRQTTAQLDLVRRFELSHKLKGHEGCVNSINFNDAGSLLASGSDDLKIFIWDWQRRRKAYSFKSGHNQNVFQSKFLPYTGG